MLTPLSLNRTLVFRRTYLLLFFALSSFLPKAHAQQLPINVFFVPRLPEVVAQKQPQLLKQINSEIAKAKKTAQVYQVLDKYLNSYQRTSVTVLRFADKTNLERYSYWSGPNAYGSSDFSKVTAAKAIAADKIYERYQFEDFFRDTLVVLDSVKIKILTHDIKVGTDPIFRDDTGSPIQQKLSKERDLILTLANPTQVGKYLTVNYQLNGSIRLKCTFYFLTAEDKAELAGVLNGLKESPASAMPLTADDIQLAVKQYILERFGQPKGWKLNQLTGL